MATASSSIHPSASVDESARIGEDVRIEQGVIVGPGCVVGDGTRLRARCMLVRDTVLGERNDVHPFAVLGGDPQDVSFDESVDPGRLEIGDAGVFREGVTISRGCGDAGPTTIGDSCMFMANAHAGHNVRVGDAVILANCVSLAGHSRVEGGCFFSATSNLHQFVDMGELVMVRAWGGATMHVPPYCILKTLNELGGINVVGLRRSGRFSPSDIDDIRLAYRMVLRRSRRESGSMGGALELAREREWSHGARHMLDWIARRLESEAPRSRGVVSG
ncbi:MAG: acyl-ACP--UDP-N-acetylglucosamine O-acyltransferase [Planctomycetota bacterium]|jgi:UDP-N-acetylglucosamine acyltransferase